MSFDTSECTEEFGSMPSSNDSSCGLNDAISSASRRSTALDDPDDDVDVDEGVALVVVVDEIGRAHV